MWVSCLDKKHLLCEEMTCSSPAMLKETDFNLILNISGESLEVLIMYILNFSSYNTGISEWLNMEHHLLPVFTYVTH